MTQTPRQRTGRPTFLPTIRIEIEWDGGEAVFDPNELTRAGAAGDWLFLGLPFLNIPSDGGGSGPVFLYREDDYEMALTLDELDRLARRALSPPEYRALLSVFGPVFTLHDDFYDEDGVAWQSRPRGAGFPASAARLRALTEEAELSRSLAGVPAQAPRPLRT